MAGDIRPEARDAILGAPAPRCVYVYDTEALTAMAGAVKQAMPDRSAVLYAMKANGHPAVVSTLAGRLDGVEVSSGGELVIARAAGARRIAFGGPAKTDTELAAAIEAHRAGIRITVNVESTLELRRLDALLGGADHPLPVALRVNRGGHGLAGSHRMAGVPTPFGIDEAALAEATMLAAMIPGIDLVGFHLHAVSNNRDAHAHGVFVRDAVRWAVGQAGQTGVRLRELNVGGGFGVDYTGSDAFDLDALRGGLAAVDDMLPPDAELVVEPGRLLAAAAGWYATEVLDLKRTHGRWFAVLRGGTHHFRLPAAWGYSHPFTVLPVDQWRYGFPRPAVTGVEIDAVGELCTPRDVLTRAQPVARLRVGDVLCFANTGAYGWDISHHEFLRHPYPEVIVV
jgi:diaminopimelate decarboxylase